jgi:hypothetical protein
MMLVLIDRGAGLRAMRDSPEYGDHRSYYQLERTLIVCRNGLTLSDIQGWVVDAAIGTEPYAMPGFCPEWQIGQRRTKITVYRRVLDKPAETTLTAILAKQL